MATSGTTTFSPQFADLLSEAFARILIRPLLVTQEHIDEAIRSANLMLIGFANKGVYQFQLKAVTLTMVAGTATYNLPVGSMDVWSAVYRKDNQDTPVWPMSRQDYQRIPDKTNPGRPYNFFSDRGAAGNTARTVTLWPAPDTSGDTIELWVWTKAEDVTGLPETLSVAFEWFDAYAAELAARMAQKFAPDLEDKRKQQADEAFRLAKGTDRERVPMRLRMRGYIRR